MSIPTTCDGCRELMLALGPTALGAARRSELQEMLNHLEQCPDCRRAAAEFEELRDTMGAGHERTTSAEPAGGWNAFADRMQAGAMGSEARDTRAATGMRPGRRWAIWRIAAGLVLAAGLGMATGLLLARPQPQPVAGGHSAENSMARLSGSELKQNVEAFDNISSVFDRRATWVMLADGGRQTDVGIAPGPVGEHATPLVIRMLVRHADAPDGTSARWAVVAQCDLVIVQGQNAELIVKSIDAHRLNFHVQTDAQNPHCVTLMLELGNAGEVAAGDVGGRAVALSRASREEDGQPLGMLATTVTLDFGNSATVGQIVTTSGVYSLAVGLDAMPAAPAEGRQRL